MTSSPTTHSVPDHEARSLSTRELVSRLVKTGSLLITKEVELARAEIKADLQAELGVLKLLIAAAVAAVLGSRRKESRHQDLRQAQHASRSSPGADGGPARPPARRAGLEPV